MSDGGVCGVCCSKTSSQIHRNPTVVMCQRFATKPKRLRLRSDGRLRGRGGRRQGQRLSCGGPGGPSPGAAASRPTSPAPGLPGSGRMFSPHLKPTFCSAPPAGAVEGDLKIYPKGTSTVLFDKRKRPAHCMAFCKEESS